MLLTRNVKPTITPIGLWHGDMLRFVLTGGEAWELKLLSTRAWIVERMLNAEGQDVGVAVYAFEAVVEVNGKELRLEREVGSQKSFYEPWEIDGVWLWFDAISAPQVMEGVGIEERPEDLRGGGAGFPHQHARFAVQEATLPVCPEPLQLWYPNETGFIDIHDCYDGQDCWLGPYEGRGAHTGLDVNMPKGTLLYTPLALDDQYLYNSKAAGHNNNRWRGVRRWPDGTEWWVQAAHMYEMLVPDRTPLGAGVPYARAAGEWCGNQEHSHFYWRVLEQGGDYPLDPWILFWEMLRHHD